MLRGIWPTSCLPKYKRIFVPTLIYNGPDAACGTAITADRLPATPSTIIELLSHQNFADMKLGHDPNFKFTVGRAIYKAVLQFVSSQHNKEYVVQPLPVSNFAIGFGKRKILWNFHGRERMIHRNPLPVLVSI